jgi:hypothetical protein
MRTSSCAAVVLGLALAAGPGWADDGAAARALVGKGVEALGGEALLSKFKAANTKLKGVIHTGGMELSFTGEVASQGADQERVAIEFEVDGQKFAVTQVLNRDKGWVKLNNDTTEMDADKLAQTKEEAYAGWVATLTPLKDKAFTLATTGEVTVEDRPAVGVRVARKGYRDVVLYFDKKTHLLVKTESRVKDEDSGQEVTQETFLSGYEGKEAKMAMKITVKRDGKAYLEAEVTDFQPEEKLDDSVFAKP